MIAQEASERRGILYQGVARTEQGQAIPNFPVYVRIAFTNGIDSPNEYFAEIHSVMTDQNGFFDLIIGSGETTLGAWNEIPWAEQQIWVDMELAGITNPSIRLEHTTQLLSVPHALYAESAKELSQAEAELRNHSIYWLTRGNAKTRPPVHFLGTRDDDDFVVKTNGVERANFSKDGQLTYNSGVTGPDSDPNSYPLIVEGSSQGIYIMVNGSRSTANNFVTFADANAIWGTIEGQTSGELAGSPAFIIQTTLYALELARLGVQVPATYAEAAALYAAGTGAAASLIFAFAAAGFYASAVAVTAKGVVLTVELAALITNAAAFYDNAFSNIGVTFTTGSADYAEYLKVEPGVRDLEAAEIVGIKGGVASLNTSDADHVLVVSTNPGFLGNQPKPEVESQYEKIAFMGQVPVKVDGPVQAGDYILPSGLNDGIGKAVKPADLPTQDFDKIIGTAWTSHTEDQINYVTVGIGINKQDLAPRIEKMDQDLDAIINYLEGKGPMPGNDDPVLATMPLGKVSSEATFEEFDRFVDERADQLFDYYNKTREQLRLSGYDISKIPGVEQ
ncbi:MAG: hypothetical protein AAF242_19040, partial [Bacteroidota bacterium]